MTLSESELAYAAGIFDGEGTVGITRLLPSDKRKTPYYHIRAEVSNTDLDLINLFKKWFGGHVYAHKGRELKNSKPYYTWVLSSKSAYRFLNLMKLFTRIKQERAILAIEFYEKCKKQKKVAPRNSDGTLMGGPALSPEQLSVRDSYYERMAQLNKRGLNPLTDA